MKRLSDFLTRTSSYIAYLAIPIVLSLCTFVLVHFIVSPYLFRVTPEFSYSVDILSLDNLYLEETGAYSGETRSVTLFGYSSGAGNADALQVVGTYDVSTLGGDEIISLKQDYLIDPLTGVHLGSVGARSTEPTYLFAPRWLNKGQSFTYKHINYDTPLTMTYDGEETVEGAHTYRYTSSILVDQTSALEHLPLVPEERGIVTEGTLTVWVEPVSGWLVKYSDGATAYYYDRATRERLMPWNTFRNSYTKTSIGAQARYAQARKEDILFVEYGIPALVLMFVGLLLYWRRHPHTRRTIGAIAIMGIACGVLFSVSGWFLSHGTAPKQLPIVIGVSRWVPFGNSAYDDNIQGFKDALEQAGYREGVDVVYDVRSANSVVDEQHAIAQSFKDQGVALIYSLTTPGTTILQEEIRDIPIVFSVVTYPVETGIVASLNRSENNLVGTRNWVSVETHLSTFRELVPSLNTIGFVHRKGETNSAIQLEEMRNAGATMGIDVVEIAGKDVPELTTALEESEGMIDSIFSACDTLVQGQAEQMIIAYARTHNLPSYSCNNSGPKNGDLLGTVADLYQIGGLAGTKAAHILEGATPSSLETDTALRPYLYINQKTADALGITIPQEMYTRAKEILF
jgi:putative tryptophan/tyrosine transport system substrate-binding protein